jgi:hypothetical protein
MSVQILNESLRPSEAMAALVARHGAARMVLAMLVALVRPTRRLSAQGLSDHLRRDIGLDDRR